MEPQTRTHTIACGSSPRAAVYLFEGLIRTMQRSRRSLVGPDHAAAAAAACRRRLRSRAPPRSAAVAGARAAAPLRRRAAVAVRASADEDVGAAGTAAIALGLLANPLCLWSEYTLKTTGAGLPPGPGARAAGWAGGRAGGRAGGERAGRVPMRSSGGWRRRAGLP